MKTLIIAEIGINHGGSVDEAKRLIKAALASGADVVKFQTYTTEKRVALGHPAFDILKKCELTYDQQRELKSYADSLGIEFCSTPFDVEAIGFLVEDLGLRRIKIASFDTANISFLKEVNNAAINHPNLNVIVSTGMTTSGELLRAIDVLKDVKHLTLLHCKSAYPPVEDQINMNCIGLLSQYIKCEQNVGYSNHSKDPVIPAISVMAGARVVEAHFMVDASDNCCDAPVSLDGVSFRKMVDDIRRFEKILGVAELKIEECEKGTLIFKRT